MNQTQKHMTVCVRHQPKILIKLLHFMVTSLCLSLAVGIMPASAQTTARIRGTILDVETGEPLSGVNVFLAHTLRGTTTDNKGYYELTGIPPNAYQLTASMVGYRLTTQDIELYPGTALEIRFRLVPAVYELDEVAVTAERDVVWRRHFTQFQELFLGQSDNAEKTEILNPYVLDFQVDPTSRLFSATATDALEIENRALGYRLYFVLRQFRWDPHSKLFTLVGLPRFEEMTPESERQARGWEERRRAAYNGSTQHLFRSLGEGRAFEEGFQLVLRQHNSQLVEGKELVSEATQPYAARVAFNGWLGVHFQGHSGRGGFLRRRSQSYNYGLFLTAFTGFISRDGTVSPAGIIRTSGYPKRVADFVPREYGMEEVVEPDVVIVDEEVRFVLDLVPVAFTYYIEDERPERELPSRKGENVQRALDLIAEERWDRAADVLGETIREDPDDLEARYFKAICHREHVKAFPALAHENAAIEQFESILAVDSLYRDVLYQYALLKRYREEYHRAVELAEAQQRIRPELDHAHHGLFGIYRAYIYNSNARRVLQWLVGRPGPHARYFLAEVLRSEDRPDEAEAIFQDLTSSDGNTFPRQPALLSLARIYYDRGETGMGQGWVEEAIRTIDRRLTADLVFDDIKYLVSRDELDEYRSINTPEGYRFFFRVFWVKRDPVPASTMNVRLSEHYRRLMVAEKDHLYAGLRIWQTDPDKTGQLDFPPSYEINQLFNDKGLIYIRHGEPAESEFAIGIDIPLNESWRYNNPRMDFHFVLPGGGNNWRISPTMPMDREILLSREHWGGYYSEMAQAFGYPDSGIGNLDENNPFSRVADLEREEVIDRMEDASRAAVAYAFETDRHTWDEETEPLTVPYLIAAFRGEEDLTRLELHYALPGGEITQQKPVPSDSLDIELGLALHDSTWSPLVEHADVITVPSSADPESHYVGAMTMSVPADSYHVAFHARPQETRLLGAYRFETRLPDFYQNGLTMSDLVPAFNVTVPDDVEAPGRSDVRIAANPYRRFATDRPVYIFFELYNLTYGADDLTHYTLEFVLQTEKRQGLLDLVDRLRDDVVLSLKTERVGDEASPAEYAEIDVSAVDPGRYTLTVVVTDEQTGAVVSRTVSLELEDR